uniref:CCHC-type domain-containing protein n=1 Tax=Cannabis sativa TaxID=3483 RepID=A0A803PR37_CANSA
MAAKTGEVITVNNSDISKMVADGFFRFRVWMSIKKPVCPGFSLSFAGKKMWIAFKYDELPYMCFKCGMIGHCYKECHQEPVTMAGEGNEVVNAYGTWLKSEKHLSRWVSGGTNLAWTIKSFKGITLLRKQWGQHMIR